VDLPDVNILVYAFRADLPQHSPSGAWLDGAIAGETQFGLSPLVLSAVVRITTNARIFREPTAQSEVFDFCQALMEQPNAADRARRTPLGHLPQTVP
jgi:predicted nucleic acid-binding protein